jgi:hypothetical protein
VDFTSKLYLKYQYQPSLKGPKTIEKEAFLKTINGSLSDHLYRLHPFGKRNHCFFCPKKSNLGSLKEQKTADFEFQTTFKLNQNNLTQGLKSEQLKREQIRGKRTKW